jgi:hypothetical protein
MSAQVRMLFLLALVAMAAGWVGLRSGNADLEARRARAAATGEKAP